MSAGAGLTRLDAHQKPIIPLMRDPEVRFICNEVGTELFVTVPEWRGFGHAALAREVAAEQGFAVLTAPVDAPKAPGVLDLPTGDPTVLPPEPALLAPDDLPCAGRITPPAPHRTRRACSIPTGR